MASKPTKLKPSCTGRDIARALNLAQSTVSMALADNPRINPETRRQVTETANRLGYQPNRVARAMRTGRSHLIGVLVPTLRVSFFSDLVDAIGNAASAAGYRCLLAQSLGAPARFDSEVELLLAQRVDGLLLCPANPFTECAFSHRLTTLDIPTLLFSEENLTPGISEVGSDWTQIGKSAAAHLLGLGHRHVLCLHVVPRKTNGRICIHAAQEEVSAAGGTATMIPLSEAQAPFDAFTAAAMTAIAAHPQATAILVTDDGAAAACVRAAATLGRRVPADLSIISCAALDLGRWSTPTITAMDQSPLQLGEEGIGRLLRRMHGGTVTGVVRIAGVLLPGGTTAAVRNVAG